MPYNESRDSSFMYNLTDLKGDKPKLIYNKNTILGFLHENEDKFSKFIRILEISELIELFNNSELNKTIFIPSNNNISNDFMKIIDKNIAIAIIKYSSLYRKIDKKIILSSPTLNLMSEYRSLPRLYVQNSEFNSQINNSNILKFDIILSNGIIHIIDNLLIPSFIN